MMIVHRKRLRIDLNMDHDLVKVDTRPLCHLRRGIAVKKISNSRHDVGHDRRSHRRAASGPSQMIAVDRDRGNDHIGEKVGRGVGIGRGDKVGRVDESCECCSLI